MPKYQYITRSNQPAFFEAADDSAAPSVFNSLTDRDPRTGYSSTPGTTVPNQSTPASPKAPTRDYKKTARSAGAAGLSMSDYSSLLGPTPDEENAAKDVIARQFGYDSADSFFADTFRKPSKTTEQFYRSAYDAAGLPKYITNISRKREALAKALGVIGDNPWLDEESRSGKARRLQDLAYADIGTLENEYKLRLDHVRDLVSRHADDLGDDERIRDARLKYLENAVKEATTATAKNRAMDNLTDYLEGRQSSEAEAPKTVSVGEGQALYKWNPTTNDFELVTQRPKTYAPKRAGSGSGTTGAGEDKVLDKFNTDLTKINPKTETREALLARLIAKYGNKIDPQDITRKVMETYPDGWETRYRVSTRQTNTLDKYNE